MGGYLIFNMAISLALTLVLEVLLALLLGVRERKDLLLLCMVNLLTNPVVVFLYQVIEIYTYWNSLLVIIPLEVFAIITEGFYFKKYGLKIKEPYLFAVLINVFSYGIGKLITLLW